MFDYSDSKFWIHCKFTEFNLACWCFVVKTCTRIQSNILNSKEYYVCLVALDFLFSLVHVNSFFTVSHWIGIFVFFQEKIFKVSKIDELGNIFYL